MSDRVQIVKTVLNASGDVQAGLNATVFDIGTSNQATVYEASEGPNTLGQPLTTDSNGGVPGWLQTGAYEISVEGGPKEELHAVSAASDGSLLSHGAKHNNGGSDPITSIDAAIVTSGQFAGARILDDAITEPKIGSAAVTQNKIADGSITAAKWEDAIIGTQAGEQITSSSSMVNTNCTVSVACPAGYAIWFVYFAQGRSNLATANCRAELYSDTGAVTLASSDSNYATAYADNIGIYSGDPPVIYKPTGTGGQTYRIRFRFSYSAGSATDVRIRNMQISARLVKI